MIVGDSQTLQARKSCVYSQPPSLWFVCVCVYVLGWVLTAQETAKITRRENMQKTMAHLKLSDQIHPLMPYRQVHSYMPLLPPFAR